MKTGRWTGKEMEDLQTEKETQKRKGGMWGEEREARKGRAECGVVKGKRSGETGQEREERR